MLRSRSTVLATVALLVLPLAAAAQELITLDLAGSQEVSIQAEPGNYSFELRNAVPRLHLEYKVVVQHNIIRIPDLEAPRPSTGAAKIPSGLTEQCKRIKTTITEINTASTEGQMASLNRLLRSLACDDPVLRKAREGALDAARRPVPGVHSLGRGEELVVTVERPGEKNEPERWKLTLTTGARGEWNTGYGFVFIPDNSDKPFLETLGGDPAQFQIGNGEGKGFRSVPAGFYSWTPRSAAGRDWSLSLLAGLGVNLADPSVFLGIALTYNQNISLVGGGALTQEKHLLDRHAPGDTLSENLTPDQLLDERFEPNVFFGVSFRFGASPFGSSDAAKKATSASSGGQDTATDQETDTGDGEGEDDGEE